MTTWTRDAVDKLARHIHEVDRYIEAFGSNNCDCRVKAASLLRSVPVGYRLMSDEDYDRALLDEGNFAADAYSKPAPSTVKEGPR